jgi:hypothetical protein
LPPCHLGVIVPPPLIVTKLGIYGVDPCVIIIVVGITFPELPGIFVKFAVILAELLPILKIALLLKFNVTALALIIGLVNCLMYC